MNSIAAALGGNELPSWKFPATMRRRPVFVARRVPSFPTQHCTIANRNKLGSIFESTIYGVTRNAFFKAFSQLSPGLIPATSELQVAGKARIDLALIEENRLRRPVAQFPDLRSAPRF